MKIFISSDMEGSTGVVSTAQVTAGRPEYPFGRARQLGDVSAAVRGALDAGAERVIICDAHCSMTNLDVAEFGGSVLLASGSPKVLGMVEGAEGCDAAFFTGYHAMAGTEKAVLDHSYDRHTIYGIAVNGVKMGETGVNALLCGALGVPVAFVSGDDALCAEARSLLGPQARLCSVKEGLGRGAALCRTPEETEAEIYAAAKEAAEAARRGELRPFTLEGPYVLEISFMNTLQTDAAALVPGARRVSGRALRFECEEVFELRRFICTSCDIANAAKESY
ncbi:M55 family metallopeptidase [Cloacibacillus sp. An23]|uniref:M55 family metallopeptidase n=1 Tax=Cloacibacillus sp. An23 TaxID=1965591 RepID=UPI001302684D|nr:M55 family metallopeptidase [Cloacibacillus sp. An23]